LNHHNGKLGMRRGVVLFADGLLFNGIVRI
jgi:hypothetical protein